MIKFQKIYPNDKVAIVAPSKWVDKTELSYAINVLQSWSLTVILGKNVYSKHHFFAGSDAQRREDFQWAINHPEVKAIFCARGGYGVTRIVDSIDFSALKKHPKCLIGFSDITGLHLKLNQLGYASLHANMPALFLENASKRSLLTLKNTLFEHSISYQWSTKKKNNVVGLCHASVIGGNLTMICHCLDTLTANDFDNKILFIEDVGEKFYAIDRYLTQLCRSNKLIHLKGIIVGAFNKCEDCAKNPFEIDPHASILHHFSSLNIPIAFNFPAGHIDENCAIPFGIKLKLSVGTSMSRLVSGLF